MCYTIVKSKLSYIDIHIATLHVIGFSRTIYILTTFLFFITTRSSTKPRLFLYICIQIKIQCNGRFFLDSGLWCTSINIQYCIVVVNVLIPTVLHIILFLLNSIIIRSIFGKKSLLVLMLETYGSHELSALSVAERTDWSQVTTFQTMYCYALHIKQTCLSIIFL